FVGASSDSGAFSSKARVTPETPGFAPPASETTIAYAPVGPWSIASMSAGNVWLKPRKTGGTLATTPLSPDTEIREGYGSAVVASLIVIGPALQNSIAM